MMAGMGMGMGIGMGGLAWPAGGMAVMPMGMAAPAAPPEPPKAVEFIKDIDLNHSSQKHILTRGTFVDQLCKNSGADVRLR
jgi:hypothetical protein